MTQPATLLTYSAPRSEVRNNELSVLYLNECEISFV